MEFINEKLKTPVKGEYDIIVAGGGPAGCGAALSAARCGKKVLVVEENNCLGGMWTMGFVNPMFDFENKDGIVKELVDTLKEKKQWGGFWNMCFNYEYMKKLLEDKLLEVGVETLLNTKFSSCIKEGKSIKGIIVENADGRCAYKSKMVIDCTGDGNVAAQAGCEFEIGEGGNYKACQPMTLMFLVGNVNPKFKDGLKMDEQMKAVYEKSNLEIPFVRPRLIPNPNSSFAVIQFTHMYEYNPVSAEDVAKATMEGRRQMIEAYELLKKYDEDFKDLELISSAPMLGIRESRRIIGEYILTADDLIGGAQFEDAVADVTFNVDIHRKNDKGQTIIKIKPYQIPLRALIPKGYSGLLVAGRCISGSREAMGSYRVTGNCCQMGEKAAVCAAYAIEKNTDIRNVNVSDALKYAKEIQ